MEKGAKTAIVVLGGVTGAIVIAAIWEHYAHAAQPIGPKGKFCPDGTPAPNDDTSKCPVPHPGQNPYSPPGGWQYSGNPTADYLPSAALLAAVNPCDCANVGLVRRFEVASGLKQPGGSDGRYGPDVQKALQNAIQDIASQGYDVSGLSAPAPCESNGRPAWWGPTAQYDAQGNLTNNPYANPACATDPGPKYAF